MQWPHPWLGRAWGRLGEDKMGALDVLRAASKHQRRRKFTHRFDLESYRSIGSADALRLLQIGNAFVDRSAKRRCVAKPELDQSEIGHRGGQWRLDQALAILVSTRAMATALEMLREQYQHRDRAARAWKQAGGRVVGYLCDNVPEELILAAGAMPYRISARPGTGSQAIEQYVQVFAAPFSARNRGVGFTDAMLNMLLDGEFDFLDLLVVPHTRKTIQAFYRELSLAREADPELRLPELYYLDRTYTPFYTSEVFNRDCVVAFRRALEDWSGRTISDSAIAQAIQLTNARRELLQQLARHRAAEPPTLSGVDALQVLGASAFMHPADYNPLLTQFLSEASTDAQLVAGPRLFIGGSPLDHLQFYAMVEDCGATIVAEDHCWGNRCGEFLVDTTMPPIEALADRFHRKPACSIDFPMQRVVERCVGRALAADVDAAIFNVFEGDGVHVWDTPDEVAALRSSGIECLYLKQQPYWIDDSPPLRATVRDFLTTLTAAPSSGARL